LFSKQVHEACTSIAFRDVADIHLVLKTNELSSSCAVVYLCNWHRLNILADWAKAQNPGQTTDFRKPARTEAQKEDVSVETRTYSNPMSIVRIIATRTACTMLAAVIKLRSMTLNDRFGLNVD